MFEEVQKKTHDLHAVSVCGLVVEGRNYLLIFGLGGVVTRRVHKLQRGGREAFERSVCVYVCTWWMRAGWTHTHGHTDIISYLQLSVCVANTSKPEGSSFPCFCKPLMKSHSLVSYAPYWKCVTFTFTHTRWQSCPAMSTGGWDAGGVMGNACQATAHCSRLCFNICKRDTTGYFGSSP